MDFLIWVWVAVLCASAIVEFLSMQMVAIWFTFSAMATIVLNLCGVIWWVQVLVFCVLSLVLLLSLRKFSLKYLLKNTNQKTNADSLVGTTHKLLEKIEPEKSGSLKINGVVWTAICENKDQTLNAGEVVEITKIEGNKLFVKPCENTTQKPAKTKKGE